MEEKRNGGIISYSNLALHTLCRAVTQYCSDASDQAGMVGKTSAAGSCILVSTFYRSVYSEVRNVYNGRDRSGMCGK